MTRNFLTFLLPLAVAVSLSAVAVAQDHHRIHADLHRHVVAGLRYFAIVPDEQPIPVPDHLEIDLVFFRAAIKFPLESGLGLPSSQTAQYDIARIHDRLLRKQRLPA